MGKQTELSPDFAEVHISRSIWQPASRVRWPGKARSVKVYYSQSRLASDYALSSSQISTLAGSPEEIRIGELRGDLVVLTQSKNLNSEELRDFVSAHEAFHLAAQYYGSKIILERIGPFSAQDEAKIDDFWDEVLRVARASSQSSQDCRVLQSRFKALGPEDRRFVLGKAFWEWPAEYYARASVLSRSTDADYLRLRSKIAGNNRAYTAGAMALELVANTHGSLNWQTDIASGTNAIDVFMRTLGCEEIDGDRGLGEVTATKFIHDE